MIRITINAVTLEDARSRALAAVATFLGLAEGAPRSALHLIRCEATDEDLFAPFRMSGNATIYNWETTWEFKP